MKDINKFSSSLCHRHCWLSRTFYRTQISLTGFKKQSLLCPSVMKNLKNDTIFRFSANFSELSNSRVRTRKHSGLDSKENFGEVPRDNSCILVVYGFG